MATRTYTTSEAAAQIGVSRQTLQAWIAGREIDPPEAITLGRVTVRLWTKADIARVRQFKGTLKPGPRSNKKKK